MKITEQSTAEVGPEVIIETEDDAGQQEGRHADHPQIVSERMPR